MRDEWDNAERIRQTQAQGAYEGTMETLRQAEREIPDFTSSYDGEIAKLYDRIMNRPAFQYDVGADPLYQSFRDQTVSAGRLAMRDTVGQAAALTGGYGSSYAESVGQQQYGAYLQKLSERIPELYQAAWERYRDEGDALRGQLETASGLARAEYDREKDRRQAASQAEQQDYERRWKSYQNLISLISRSGYEPDNQELQEAGMNRGQAEALRREYLRANHLPDPKAPQTGGGEPDYFGGGSGSGSGDGDRDDGSSGAGSKEKVKLDGAKKGGSGKHRRT